MTLPGTQTRDFTHVANAVHANLLAGDFARPLQGQVMNIACGARFSLLELIDAMAGELGVPNVHEAAPPRIGEVMHSQADIGQARRLLGYVPIVDFATGLRLTLQAIVRAT